MWEEYAKRHPKAHKKTYSKSAKSKICGVWGENGEQEGFYSLSGVPVRTVFWWRQKRAKRLRASGRIKLPVCPKVTAHVRTWNRSRPDYKTPSVRTPKREPSEQLNSTRPDAKRDRPDAPHWNTKKKIWGIFDRDQIFSSQCQNMHV
jgi:hypothetical protein